MTGAQALSKSAGVQAIKTMKTDRLAVPQHVRIMMFIDDASQLEIILCPPNYKNEFGKSNAASLLRY
jgi:hypothetical protein